MFRKYVLVLFAILLMLIPARVFAVEGDQNTEVFEENTSGNSYYEEPAAEPWQDGNQYNNTYEEPTYNNTEEEGYQDNSVPDNGYYNGNNNQTETYEEPYEEPYVEPYVEPYTEPYTEPYVEENIEAVEPETEQVAEPEITEEEEMSISTVKGDGYDVSGVVFGDGETIESVDLILSSDGETLETTSDKDGAFTFTDVANGTYTLSATESEGYERASDPIEVAVNNRNKLGYEIAVTLVEADPEPEQETEEDLPVESAETDERAEETVDSGMSPFELVLISVGTILLAITVGILLFRKLSK